MQGIRRIDESEEEKQTAVTIQREYTKEQEMHKKKKTKQFKFEKQNITYLDVIGMTRAKTLMHKLLELPLRKPEYYKALKINKSTGIILYGPPGTGKTLLAKAVCGELGIDMCYVKVSSIKSKYVGESERNVKMLFDAARAAQPCAMFIDEADVLLQNRDGISNEGGGTELKGAVSQMLEETSLVHDDKDSHIYMLAATNAPNQIDQAHKRSGRFEYIIYISAPSFWDRRKMLKYYINPDNSGLFGSINYTLLAFATVYYSGADIEKIVKVAKINAIEHKQVKINTRTLQNALWSKEGGKSSLDPWFIDMSVKYLPERRNRVLKVLYWLTLKRLFKKYVERETKDRKFDKADVEIYKDMVYDVRHFMGTRLQTRLIRLFGRGLPSMAIFNG